MSITRYIFSFNCCLWHFEFQLLSLTLLISNAVSFNFKCCLWHYEFQLLSLTLWISISSQTLWISTAVFETLNLNRCLWQQWISTTDSDFLNINCCPWHFEFQLLFPTIWISLFVVPASMSFKFYNSSSVTIVNSV